MKNLSKLGIVMLAAAAALTSCSSNDVAENLNSGNSETLTFTAALPSSLLTRADGSSITFGDGTKATSLYYAVYSTYNDKDSLILTNYGKSGDAAYKEDVVNFTNLTASVSFKLPIGHTYKFAFWAQSPNVDCYTFDPSNATISVDYTKTLCNNEEEDAFYASAELLFGYNTTNQTITLKRPFAQLNLGITDFNEAAALGLDMEKSHISIGYVPNTLHLLTGVADGLTMQANWDYNTVPAKQTNAGAFPGVYNGKSVDAEYAAMVYVLANDKQTFAVQFNYTDGTGEILDLHDVHSIDNVPLQSNHRTNLFGELMLEEQTWSLNISPDFDLEDFNDSFSIH